MVETVIQIYFLKCTGERKINKLDFTQEYNVGLALKVSSACKKKKKVDKIGLETLNVVFKVLAKSHMESPWGC